MSAHNTLKSISVTQPACFLCTIHLPLSSPSRLLLLFCNVIVVQRDWVHFRFNSDVVQRAVLLLWLVAFIIIIKKKEHWALWRNNLSNTKQQNVASIFQDCFCFLEVIKKVTVLTVGRHAVALRMVSVRRVRPRSLERRAVLSLSIRSHDTSPGQLSSRRRKKRRRNFYLQNERTPAAARLGMRARTNLPCRYSETGSSFYRLRN